MVIPGGAATVIYSGTDTMVAIDGRIYRVGNAAPKGCNVEKVAVFHKHLNTAYAGIPQLPEPDYLKSDPGEF